MIGYVGRGADLSCYAVAQERREGLEHYSHARSVCANSDPRQWTKAHTSGQAMMNTASKAKKKPVERREGLGHGRKM